MAQDMILDLKGQTRASNEPTVESKTKKVFLLILSRKKSTESAHETQYGAEFF